MVSREQPNANSQSLSTGSGGSMSSPSDSTGSRYLTGRDILRKLQRNELSNGEGFSVLLAFMLLNVLLTMLFLAADSLFNVFFVWRAATVTSTVVIITSTYSFILFIIDGWDIAASIYNFFFGRNPKNRSIDPY